MSLTPTIFEREAIWLKFYTNSEIENLNTSELIKGVVISSSDIIPCNYVCQVKLESLFSYDAERGETFIEIKKIPEKAVKDLLRGEVEKRKGDDEFSLLEIHLMRGGYDLNLGLFDFRNADISIYEINPATGEQSIILTNIYPITSSAMLTDVSYERGIVSKNMKFGEFVHNVNRKIVGLSIGSNTGGEVSKIFNMVTFHIFPRNRSDIEGPNARFVPGINPRKTLTGETKAISGQWSMLYGSFNLNNLSSNGNAQAFGRDFEIIPRRRSVIFGTSIFSYANRNTNDPRMPRQVDLTHVTVDVKYRIEKYYSLRTKPKNRIFDIDVYKTNNIRMLEDLDVYDIITLKISTFDWGPPVISKFIILEIKYTFTNGKIYMKMRMVKDPTENVGKVFYASTHDYNEAHLSQMYGQVTSGGIIFRSKLEWKGTPWFIKMKQYVNEKIRDIKTIRAGELYEEKSNSFLDRIRRYELIDTTDPSKLRTHAPRFDDSFYVDSIPTTPFAGEGYGLVLPRYAGDNSVIQSVNEREDISFIGQYYWLNESDIPDHQDGDWLLHTKNHQSQELFDENGNHVLEARSIKLNANSLEKKTRPSPTSDGNVEIDGTQVKLGKNAASGVARINDQVQITMASDPTNLTSLSLLCMMFGLPFTSPLKGSITQGSNKVKSE